VGDIEKKDGRRLSRARRAVSDGSLAPFGAVYLALLGLGTVGALAVYLLLIAFVPGASGTRLDAMKTALLVVAGSGAGAGLYVQYRKQQTDEAKSALDHANSRRDQDKLFTERYTQAVAQLGHDKAAVRLGGVYALARIADDSVRDRPTCLEVLCAYLRMLYNPDDPAAEPAERQVRTTAQSAIVARLRRGHPGFWTDARIDLTDAYLIEPQFDRITANSFNATRATFSGDVRFTDATFSGRAEFGQATFGGHAVFNGATFDGRVIFSEATFSGDAWFAETTFGGEGAGFNKAAFSGRAEFGRATFNGRALFDDATFSEDAVFNVATFSGHAWFRGVTFGGATEFGGVTFGGDAAFSRTRFSQYAVFRGTTFSGRAPFSGATFSKENPPEWPEGFTEPAGIAWDPADAPALAPGTDPRRLAGPAAPPTAP
jgi:hypothetical protein